MKCKNCGLPINRIDANKPCPLCGSTDRLVEINETIKLTEMFKLKGTENNFIKFKSKFGNKYSKKGKLAEESLLIDRHNSKYTIKKHLVKELNQKGEWEVVHDEQVFYKAKRRNKV